jgi:hypothetical protein
LILRQRTADLTEQIVVHGSFTLKSQAVRGDIGESD